MCIRDRKDLDDIRCNSEGTVLEKAFHYFDKHGISNDILRLELQEDFGEEKCMLLDSQNIDAVSYTHLDVYKRQLARPAP